MTLTVAQMKQTNHYVREMPDVMLKKDSAVISNTQIKVHAVVHGTFIGGLPASTLPSLVKNPSLYGLGALSGVVLGGIYRIAIETVCPPSSSYYKNWKDWIVHSAAMNSTCKVVMGTINGAGLTGNVLAALMLDKSIVPLAEGVLAGAIAGNELVGFASHLICPRNENNSDNPVLDESSPLSQEV